MAARVVVSTRCSLAAFLVRRFHQQMVAIEGGTRKMPSPFSDSGWMTDNTMSGFVESKWPLQFEGDPVAIVLDRAWTRSCRHVIESSSSVLVMLTKPGPSAQPGMPSPAPSREIAYAREVASI